MLSDINFVKVEVGVEQKYIPISVDMYDLFFSKGKRGLEALMVYLHIYRAAKRQKTNKPWVTIRYIASGLKIGKSKTMDLLRFLEKDLGVIEIDRQNKKERDTNGRFTGKTYIKLKYIMCAKTVRQKLGIPCTQIRVPIQVRNA